MHLIKRFMHGIQIVNQSMLLPLRHWSLLTYLFIPLFFIIALNVAIMFFMNAPISISNFAIKLPELRLLFVFATDQPTTWTSFLVKYSVVELIMLLLYVVTFVASIALMYHALNIVHHHGSRIKENIRRTGSKKWQILIIAFISAFITTLWIATGEFIMEAYMFASVSTLIIASEVLVNIWRLLLVFGLPIIALEQVSIGYALRLSCWLIFHRLPELLGAGTWLMILTIVIQLPLVFLFSVLNLFMTNKIVMIVVSIYLQTATTIASVLLYDQLYRQKVR